jgi:hypothetical protein
LDIMRRWALWFGFFALVPWGVAQQDLVLTGDVKGTQHKTYFDVPFTVPAGVHRISVDFHYTGRDQRATLDIGIADPHRFRGESGGNKSHFTISETDATPSYLPGEILAGEWRLIIAVPNMRPGVVSHYTAEIHFNSRVEDATFTVQPLAKGTRWYRGDLHMHTGHSDASCNSQGGQKVPCPLFLTVQAAAARSLDFIAITDHNTDSHYADERELQPYFDHLLLIPGREMTTFHGHFNVFGVTQFIDWRVDLNSMLRDARAKGGMGCRWMPPADADMGLFSAVEVINYGDQMDSNAKYLDSQLRAGHRLAAVGGSDNHNATTPPGGESAIGWPTTAVEADELSVPAILDSIRRGRSFVDLTASRDKTLDFEAKAEGASAKMGGTLHTAHETPIHVSIHSIAARGSVVHLLLDGDDSNTSLPLQGETASTTISVGAGRHWLRVEVQDESGVTELMSSPLYINFPED